MKLKVVNPLWHNKQELLDMVGNTVEACISAFSLEFVVPEVKLLSLYKLPCRYTATIRLYYS